MAASNAVSGVLMTMTVEGSALAESRSFTVNLTNATIDVTNRDSAWWGQFLVGRREWTIDFEGLYIATDLGKQYLQYYWTDRTPSTLTIVVTLADGTITLTGQAILTSLTYDGPFEDAGVFSGSLQGTDTLIASAS